MNIYSFNNIDTISDFALNLWKKIAGDSIRDHGFFAVALSGGSTPLNFYRKLSVALGNSPIWSSTHIFLADERFVPSDHKDSNLKSIRGNLISHLKIPDENIHALACENHTIESFQKEYEEDIKDLIKAPEGELPSFDLIVLGIGEDGHTASLFPEEIRLPSTNRAVITSFPTNAAYKRISLSMELINSANNIIFIVTGSKKAKVVREILEGKEKSLPAALVNPVHGIVYYLLDKDAARELEGTGINIL
ncbi:6-phosphogluconolactonase [Candidatus Omnitrophota bacterium]